MCRETVLRVKTPLTKYRAGRARTTLRRLPHESRTCHLDPHTRTATRAPVEYSRFTVHPTSRAFTSTYALRPPPPSLTLTNPLTQISVASRTFPVHCPPHTSSLTNLDPEMRAASPGPPPPPSTACSDGGASPDAKLTLRESRVCVSGMRPSVAWSVALSVALSVGSERRPFVADSSGTEYPRERNREPVPAKGGKEGGA